MFAHTAFRRTASLLAAALLFTTATAQGRQAARPAPRIVAASSTAAKPMTEAPDARSIIASYANGFILTADHLYRGNGEAYEPVPVWSPEPAVITRSGQLKDGTWRIHLRTQSGIEGYVDVAHPKQLGHFLKRG